MKALSVKPIWAIDILDMQKTIVWRSWATDYRGPLLICASSGPWYAGTIAKNAICIANLIDVVPFTEEHLEDALMDEVPDPAGFAWIFEGISFIEPFEVKGKLKLYDVDDSLIKPIADDCTFVDFANEHYKPLMKWSDREVTKEETQEFWDSWMEVLAELDKRYEQYEQSLSEAGA